MKILITITIKLAALILVVLFFSNCHFKKQTTNQQANKKPNIIFIMTDDHALNAISSYGNSVNQTPNIDRIAEEGIRFDQSFCTNSICAPSRAVMLTGKYSHINGHINNSLSFDGSQQTFPKILQENNYQTALIGKWHLKSEPTGFDYWTILPGQGSYYNPDFIEMGEKTRHQGYVTELITEKTINWLEKRDTTKPFCLLMHHKAPHRTWMPNMDKLNSFDSVEIPLPPTFFDDYTNRSTAAKDQKMSIWKDMYLGYDLKLTKNEHSTEIIEDLRNWEFERMTTEQRNKWDKAYRAKNKQYHHNPPKGKDLARWKYQRYMQDYLSTIESVDESVGQILDYLDKNQLAENTIIVYTSDQGFYLGEHGWFDKRFMYEESHKMPLIIRYPKEIQSGRISNDMVLNLDFAATFLDYAGIAIPADIQGESLRPLLKGETPTSWREEVYYHYYEYPKGGHDVKRHYGIRTHDFKLIHYYYDIDEWELFDLINDPQELHNLYNNPNYQNTVQKLKIKLQEIREKYKDNNQDAYLPKLSIKTIHHKALGAKTLLTFPYSSKYPAGGITALTDGRVSINDLSQINDRSMWQGYEEADLLATIDLKDTISIKTITVGFLHNTDAWIFSPDWVKFSISNQANKFDSVITIERPISIKSKSEQKIFYTADLQGLKARYIHIHAKNIAQCPTWHKGAENKAWLFTDEIIVY